MYEKPAKDIQKSILDTGAYVQISKGEKRIRTLTLLFPNKQTQTFSGESLRELLEHTSRGTKHNIQTGKPFPCSNTDWLLLNRLYLSIRPEKTTSNTIDLRIAVRSDKANLDLFEATENANNEDAHAKLLTKTEDWAQALRASLCIEVNLDDLMENGY